MKKHYYSSFLLGLFFLFLQTPAQAQLGLFLNQKLKVDYIDSKLNVVDTTIDIRFNLKGPKNRYYNTYLYYSNNGGNSFKGPQRTFKGDFGDSTRAGKYKTVSWYFFKDNPYFDGQNTIFKIEAVEIPKNASGGPKNAFLSLLVPGLGDGKVRNGYNYGWITALTYGSLGAGVYYHFRARSKFDDYEARLPNTEEEHNNLYDEARRSQRISRGFLIAGGGIWLADIIGVYIRGLKNKRRLRREQEEAESSDEISFIPNIIPSQRGGISQISLTWDF